LNNRCSPNVSMPLERNSRSATARVGANFQQKIMRFRSRGMLTFGRRVRWQSKKPQKKKQMWSAFSLLFL